MTKIQLRRDTSTNWTSANPILASGEPAFETDTGKFKIGDGVTAYNSLPYKGEAGVDDYEDLTSKPQINSITLEGNKTATDLGLASTDDVNELETSKQNVFTVQKPIYLDKKQELDKVGWGYQNPYLVPQNEINLTQHASPTYIQYNTDSTNKMPSNYILFPLYEQDTDPASAIIKVPISNSANNYEKLFFGKYVDGYFVPLCYFAYQSFSGSNIHCKPYAIGGVDYTNPSVTSVSASNSVATINIEGSKTFQMSTRDLQVQGGWGQQRHTSITSQPLDNLFAAYWAYGGNMWGMAINLNRNTETNTVTRIGCTYTNGTDTYMITSVDTDLCELLSEATFALYCFDVSTPTATNYKHYNQFGYYKYSDTSATTMPWLLTGQGIDEFWTNVLQHNSFTTGAEILESNNLRLGIDNNTIKVNNDGNLYANISIPSNITTQGNTFNGASQLVQLDSSGKLPAIDGSQLTNLPGGSAPTNMVTTDTEQTITGTKTFENTIYFTGDINFGSYGFTYDINLGSLVSPASNCVITIDSGENGSFKLVDKPTDNSLSFIPQTDYYRVVGDLRRSVDGTDCPYLTIWTGTEADYTGLATKDANMLYRTTDTNKVFLGTIQLGGNA